jgi:hypothetical protein
MDIFLHQAITTYALMTEHRYIHVTNKSDELLISWFFFNVDKGNNKITELRTILQRESQNS